jgi:hypothetical protein
MVAKHYIAIMPSYAGQMCRAWGDRTIEYSQDYFVVPTTLQGLFP